MLNRAKQRWSDLVHLLFRNNDRSDSSGRDDMDPRMCGLKDAVRRGFFQGETGELATGFKICAQDVVLDVGCGDGEAILFCARQGAHIVFSDVDEKKIRSLISKANQTKARKIEGFVSDTMPLPIPDEYATKILSMEVLEHTDHPEKILAELVRVGKSGARYFITVPDARSEMLQKPIADPIYFSPPNHIHVFDKERFIQLIEDSGLIIERYDTWGFYWSIFILFFWIVARHNGEEFTSAIRDEIKPPYHPVLQNWSNTWAALMDLKGSDELMNTLDHYLPKMQLVIAKKR